VSPTSTADNVVSIKGKAVDDDVHRGQLRIAERFVKRYADELLYVHGLGWHYWGGTHWIEDKNGKARRRVTAHLKELITAAWRLEGDEREAMFKDIRKCESAAGVGGVLDCAKFMHPMTTSAETINTDPYLFNAVNGTLNLKTGELQPHNPRDLITRCAGTEVDPHATSDTWTGFLSTVLPDIEVRNYLARLCGLAMLGEIREHTLPIMTGTGGNGKSVMVETVMAAFGDYALTVDPKLVIRTKSERHGTFLADLHGARLVVTSETDEGDKLAAGTVKTLTGGDRIRANRMRSDPFEFTPSHTLLMVTNHTPKVSGDDQALWRRLTIVPFDVVVPVEDRDTTLPGRLRREHLPAVLAWCLAGWLDYQARGMAIPEKVRMRTSAYQTESDPIGQFIEAQCVVRDDVNVMAGALHKHYSMWAFQAGHPAMTATDFGKRMTDRFEKKQTNKGAKYLGVGLAAEHDGGLEF
jgi:putative DNA primase/helicase